MIKPVTFRDAANLKAELYALDAKTRFRGLTPDGYYRNYGAEFELTTISYMTVDIGSGAAMIQGRMVVGGGVVDLGVTNYSVGVIAIRIETNPTDPANRATFKVYTGATLSDITLAQSDNVCALGSDSTNKVYEVALYKYEIAQVVGAWRATNFVKLLPAIDDVGYYLHRVFTKLTDGTPFYVDMILSTPTAISTFTELYNSIISVTPATGRNYIPCIGADATYNSTYYEICAEYNSFYISNTQAGGRLVIPSNIDTIRDSVFEL